MRDREKGFVSAVIYVHNAADRVGGFLEMVIRVLEENFEHSEIICVDDRSEEGGGRGSVHRGPGVRVRRYCIRSQGGCGHAGL